MTPAKNEKDKEKTKTEPKSKPKAGKGSGAARKPKGSEPKKTTKDTKGTAKAAAPESKRTAKKELPKKVKIGRTRKVQKAHKGRARKEAAEDKVKKTPIPTKPDVYLEGTKEVNIYSVKGVTKRKIKLPIAFDEGFRLDLIRRAVKSARANRRQPYGPSPMSGMSHSTSTWGKGRGAARVQRLVDGRRAVESPNNVGGRRAHPPTADKVWAEKVNKKERKKARRAALAVLTDPEAVAKRGHRFDSKFTLPLILEDEFENVQKTKNAMEVFKKIGVYDDIIRAMNGKHVRAGKGKSRGRRYRIPKSVLIVASDDALIANGVNNLTGVDIVTPDTLSIEHLAPGGDPGRLTIITESALKAMGNW